jgi:superfamily II DNA or RNA helicase
MRFIVGNNRTQIEDPDPSALHVMDREMRYATDVAELKATGFDPTGSSWDGWIRLLRQPKTDKPWFPTGLLSLALRCSAKMQVQAEVEDRRSRPEAGFPEMVQIGLRDYQQEAVRRAVAIGYGVLDMPPRSGKTRTMMEIVRQLALRTLWIAPTDRIVDQTRIVMDDLFGRNYGIHLVGTGKEQLGMTANVVLATAATASRFSQEFLATRQVLAIDEYHHAAAKTYRDLFESCSHVFHRYGMTGTFFRSGEDDLALRAYLSDTIFRITASELVDAGHLVRTKVAFLPVGSPKLRGLPAQTFQSGHGKLGIQEHVDRNRMAAWAAAVLRLSGRKVLVLVGTKKQGRLLQDLISGLLPQGAGRFHEVEYVSTEVPRPRQKEVVEAFVEGPVGVLIGTSLLGEGVDLPSADALVYAKGERAEVTLIQNAYRVSTAAGGKRYAVIVDFADRHHRKLLEHSVERLAVYYREPTFSTEILDDPADLTRWLTSLGPHKENV